MYEIWSLGHKPFETAKVTEVDKHFMLFCVHVIFVI